MNKKYISLTICCITLFFLSQFFFKSEILLDSFYQSIKLWFNNLFPSIFIFFIITDILSNYHFPYYLSKIFGKLTKKIYKIPSIASYIILMSMTSGFPGNSKLIKEQLDNKTINSFNATKILTMTHFSNPLFIIYTIGIKILNNQKIGLIILLVHFLTNFIIGYLFRNIYLEEIKEEKLILKKSLPFMEVLKNSITNSFFILINVLGIIIFFSLITTTINLYLNLNNYSNTLLNGLMEITKGLSLLNDLNLSIIKKATLATFFISFGGFSIHMQIMSILNNYKINYLIYLVSRILHAAISSILVFIILFFFY